MFKFENCSQTNQSMANDDCVLVDESRKLGHDLSEIVLAVYGPKMKIGYIINFKTFIQRRVSPFKLLTPEKRVSSQVR